MKILFLTAAILININACSQTQAECEACTQRIINDPHGMVQKLLNACKNNNDMLACYQATYAGLKLSFKYCSPCFKGNELVMFQESLAKAEAGIRALQSDLPAIEGHYPYAFLTGEVPQPDNTPQGIESSGQRQDVNDNYPASTLDQKLARLERGSDDDLADQELKIERIRAEHAKIKAAREQAKSEQQGNVQKKINRAIGSGKMTCIKGGPIVYMVGTGFSSELSMHSINGEMPWSNWIAIPGTTLQLRYSNKKVCHPPDWPVTIDPKENLEFIDQASDQFFDYAFFQFRNVGPSTISGGVNYLSAQEDDSNYSGSEPFYLGPGETAEEDLGSWYIGCELLSVQIDNYCINP